jgi:hypothetical protein
MHHRCQFTSACTAFFSWRFDIYDQGLQSDRCGRKTKNGTSNHPCYTPEPFSRRTSQLNFLNLVVEETFASCTVVCRFWSVNGDFGLESGYCLSIRSAHLVDDVFRAAVAASATQNKPASTASSTHQQVRVQPTFFAHFSFTLYFNEL